MKGHPVLERDITRQIKKLLDNIENCWYFKVAGGQFQRAGIPDIIGCLNGKYFAIEVKRPGGKLSEKQKKEIEAIKSCNGIVFVAYSTEDVIKGLGLPDLFSSKSSLNEH